MTQELTDELAFWREAHETAHTKGGALVAWGVYAGLRIARDGSLDDAQKEMASQLFEQRAKIGRLEADLSEFRNAAADEMIKLRAEIEQLRGIIYRNCDPMAATAADAKVIDDIAAALEG